MQAEPARALVAWACSTLHDFYGGELPLEWLSEGWADRLAGVAERRRALRGIEALGTPPGGVLPRANSVAEFLS